MLERELVYRMPFERLLKVSRLASRKAFGVSWLLMLGLFAIYVIALAVILAFDRPINDWLATHGLPEILPFGAIIAGFLIACWWLRRRGLKTSKGRADYDSEVRFRTDPDGLRFATPEIEYFLRWHGISQLMLVEGQGLLTSHGNLFFLLPNEAFGNLAERDALTRDVFARLSEAARARSLNFIPPALRQPGDTSGP